MSLCSVRLGRRDLSSYFIALRADANGPGIEHVDTLHRPRDDRDQQATQCGALVHVSPEHVEICSEQTIPRTDRIKRCGRCYRGANRY